MRSFEILRQGNTHSKVTITPSRVTVKIGKDEQQSAVIIAASKIIAAQVDVDQAMRGVFDWSTRKIKLESDVKSKNKIVLEYDF